MTRRIVAAIVSVVASVTLTLMPTGVPAATASGVRAVAAGPVSLEQAVSDAMIAAKADDLLVAFGAAGRAAAKPLVEPKRSAAGGDWVFGGGVFLVPDSVHAAPVTSLFFAARGHDGTWQVAIEGSGEFARRAGEAPAALFVDEGERASLAAPPWRLAGKDAGQPTGLALPWRKGQGGWLHSGVHGRATVPTAPYNAVDFYGGDGTVRASAGGYRYRYCTTVNPYIEVRHPNGWTTGYYHQRELTDVPDGSWIDAYDVIGVIAEELPCGGVSNRPHVHWALLRDDEPIHVDGKTVGGWTWHADSTAYAGYAERKGLKLYKHECCLTNYGARRVR